MDEMVLETQKWLNRTYSKINGYEPAPENGRTGWPTIYALREALQHEAKSAAIGEGFGSATEAAVSTVIGKLVLGYHGNLATLIQGAFWCKGINPGDFSDEFSSMTIKAIKELQNNAGLVADGVMTTELMKALFDMSAFTLIPGGSSDIRKMQQFLNCDYHEYFGILPCDGYYQRATNTALIYALQAAEGMPIGTANGFYGPGTARLTPTLSLGDSGKIVKILQYGLMVNGFYDGPFDGIYNENISDAVTSFRQFMGLNPYTDIADLTVMKGLLSTNGDTNRNSIACDTAKQLNSDDVQVLKSAEFSIVGRYLTGTAGKDENERPKNLTVQETKIITNAGLRIFPIYQDGGWYENYFTAPQGDIDADRAEKAASKLGFPAGTTIYFAVDADIEEGNILGTVEPYISTVSAKMKKYKAAIYGTRNVCAHAIQIGAVENCFVSDMSTGYSGNLGFKMPGLWAFDQFTEYNLSANLGIDQVAASGRDMGVGADEFQNNGEDHTDPQDASDIIAEIVNETPALHALTSIDFKLSGEKHLAFPFIDIYVKWADNWNIAEKNTYGKVEIKNGKVTTNLNSLSTQFPNIFQDTVNTPENLLNQLAPHVGNSDVYISPTIKNGIFGIKLVIKGSKKSDNDSTIKYSLSVETYSRPGGLMLTQPEYEVVSQYPEQINNYILTPEQLISIGNTHHELTDQDKLMLSFLGISAIVAFGGLFVAMAGGFGVSSAIATLTRLVSTLKPIPLL